MAQHSTARSTRSLLNQDLGRLEDILQADVLTIFGPILPGLEKIIKNSVERIRTKSQGTNSRRFRHSWWYR